MTILIYKINIMKKFILLFAFVFSLVAVGQDNERNQGIYVTGEGIEKIKPDQVVIKSQIEHEGLQPADVKSKNDETVDKIIKFLKNEQIAEKNIKTDYVNLNKRYNYNDKSYTYVASQAISITLEDLENYEGIIMGLLENGLTGIQGIQFKSSEMEEHKTEARRKAILDARRKAEEFAAPLNQEVGKAFLINESSGEDFQPVYRVMEMKASMDEGGSSQETLAPGEMEVKIKVNVGFQLN